MTSPSRVAVVSGYFNPLHVGHLRMIQAARASADHLVVIVNNDAQQQAKIGRIVQPVEHRIEVVAALRAVDETVAAVDEDATVKATIRLLRDRYPGAHLIFANGGGDRSDPDSVAEIGVCEELGIEVRLGVGGTDKADASSRINRVLDELGRLPARS